MPATRTLLGAVALALLTAASPPAAKPASPPPPAASPQVPAATLIAVQALQPGLWQLLITDGGHTVPREICLGDARQLLQLRHGASSCGSLVVANDAKMATVQYSCPGAGWGRTTLRPATAVALHIDSQGIADNAPFAFTAEGRRIADCSSPPATATVATPPPGAR